MNYKVNTRYEELTLVVTVQTLFPCKIRIKVYDMLKPKTVFTDRYKTVGGTENLYVRMPLSSENVIISVYNEAIGNVPQAQDNSFSVKKIDKIPLEKRTDVSDILDMKVRGFVDFAQRFAYNASYLEDNKDYQSSDRRYLIEYLPTIVSPKSGQPLATPAMINNTTGRIKISKKLFDGYTVPMRMIILLHEFSHFYMNVNQRDEVEADLNALLIYLSLGYPRIEAHQGFLEVFIGTPSQQNKNRYDIIDKFINDFENKKIVM